jgi:hypothetical protein
MAYKVYPIRFAADPGGAKRAAALSQSCGSATPTAVSFSKKDEYVRCHPVKGLGVSSFRSSQICMVPAVGKDK